MHGVNNVLRPRKCFGKLFDYLLKLHHTQTGLKMRQYRGWFDYLLKLHHTQTALTLLSYLTTFDYLLKLHHTQTCIQACLQADGFDYLLKLHHTQTSKFEYFYAPHAAILKGNSVTTHLF